MGSTGLTELSANLESEFCHYQPCRKSCTSVGTGDIRWTFANKYTKNGHLFPQTVTKCNGKKDYFYERERKKGRKEAKEGKEETKRQSISRYSNENYVLGAL